MNDAAINIVSPDGLPMPRRHWALAGLWIGTAMSVMDASIMNIALPTISRDLAVSSATVTWVVTAYQVAIVMALLPIAALGERLGYHRIYLSGMVLFIIVSLGCAFAQGLEWLASLRFLQGLGAAMMMGVNGAQMRYVWPRALLGRGIGYNAVVVSSAAAAGPPLAGFLLSLADWPWLFLVNIPTGLLSLFLVTRFGPKTPPVTQSFDWLSALLNVLMFGGLFLAASEVVHGGLSSWGIGCASVGGTAGIFLISRSRRNDRPMIPFDLIKIKPMRLAYCASICAFAAQMCMLVSLPFLLEEQLAIDVGTVGLVLLPLPISLALTSPVAGRLSDRHWAGLMSAIGLCLAAIVMGTLAMLSATAPPAFIFAIGVGLCGVGYGLFQAPNNNVMLRTAPIERAGGAAGLQATCRQFGQTLGAMIAALALRYAELGASSALLIAAGLAFIAAAFARAR